MHNHIPILLYLLLYNVICKLLFLDIRQMAYDVLQIQHTITKACEKGHRMLVFALSL